ncbi:hypothetical protein CC86DRAFT_117738 [Ophiobolus disseminans]|uniref:Cupin type-2 domain-containing protein n=1 Tax=Ophiobolus disseminans TaxID=1469910 RepID=A0A6A6ZHI2_9PLEO|nr:hypothetical protein CC86DRAFT_117738 [Ophiobolus disseminans]
MAHAWPEQYPLAQTLNVPNSNLPALIYRNVLPRPLGPELAKQLCEKNGWERRGEWGEIKTAHFHPNTHECYAIFQGSSRLTIGRALDDAGSDGVEVDVTAGDVVVVPAGVSHRSLTSEGDYRYIGVYPNAAPRWRNNFCKGEESLDKLIEEINRVEVPDSDPVFGLNGPLPQIWKAIQSKDTVMHAKL